MKLAIVDDEPEQVEIIRSAAEAWAAQRYPDCEISCFLSAESFLFAYEEARDFDLLLLDVEMEGMDGIVLAKRLRQEGSRLEIIFITSHMEFWQLGYEVDALHYLVKPFSAQQLSGALTKAAQRLSVQPPSLVLSYNGETWKLYEKDIFYVEAFSHYLTIHTADGEYRIKESLSAFANRLSADFFKPHRSFLISLKRIVRIDRTFVTLEGGARIPLSRGKYDEINRAFIERN